MFATAFDFPSVDFLAKLDVPAYKIASGDLKNIPMLKYVASVGKPVIVSTGGGSIDDVQRVVDAVTPINPQLALLSAYHSGVADFERLFERQGREFPRFYAEVRRLAALPKAAREAVLRQP